MTNQQTFNQAAKAYRDFPLLDAKFIPENTLVDVKRIFGLLLSQERLLESIKDHQADNYSEKSPFKATLLTRLNDVERELLAFEEIYGKLSETGYTTIRS